VRADSIPLPGSEQSAPELVSGRTHARLTLRRGGDALYAVAVEPLLGGRTTTMAIDLHPVGH